MTDKLPSEKPAIPAGPLLAQLAGMPEARTWAEGVAQDVALYRAQRLNWSDMDSGCVLHGPPGTGNVIGTCNHPDRLDPALVRSGRLGRSILVPLPALDALPQILAFHLGPDAPRIGDLSGIAVMCAGMSGADVEQIVKDTRTRARRAGRAFGRSDLVAVIEARLPPRNPDTEWRIAVHEAAHAVAADRLLALTGITLSLFNSGGAPHYLECNDIEPFPTRPRLLRRLGVLLAGRAAEDVLLGEVSSRSGGGRDSDIARATRLAVAAFASQGLSETTGVFWHDPSSPIPATVLSEVKAVLQDVYASIRDLIEEERDLIEALARNLISKRALSYNEFLRIDNRGASGPPPMDNIGWHCDSAPSPTYAHAPCPHHDEQTPLASFGTQSYPPPLRQARPEASRQHDP